MYTQDDFIHGDTIVVTQRGLKAIKDVKEKDEIAVIDLAKDISFIRAPVEFVGTKGLYNTIETSIGDVKLGRNSSLFTNVNCTETVMACDIESTLIGSTINIPAVAHAHQGNILELSDLDLVLMSIINMPNADFKLSKKVRLVSPNQSYTQRAIEIFDRVGLIYDTMSSRDGTTLFIVYFDHSEISMPITKHMIENMNLDQCRTMILLYIIFSSTVLKSIPEGRALTIGVREDLYHYIGTIAMKTGFPVMWKYIYYHGKMIYCLFLYRSYKAFPYKIEGVSLSQHEYEDIVINLPKRYIGLLTVNNGRFIILPTQKTDYEY